MFKLCILCFKNSGGLSSRSRGITFDCVRIKRGFAIYSIIRVDITQRISDVFHLVWSDVIGKAETFDNGVPRLVSIAL